MIKKANILAIAKDRTAILLLIAVCILTIVIVITTIVRLHPSDVQIPARYTAYGVTYIYRDHWYMHAAYAVFAVVVTTVNSIIVVNLYQLRRLLSLGIMAMTLFTLLVCLAVSNAVFNLTPRL